MAGLVGLLNYLDERKGREQYGNLLDQYTYKPPPLGTLGDDGLSIPAQSGFVGQGGLVSGGPPQEFYLRAGQIPGYQNLVHQAQVGQQAMERQMQGQQWSMANMPLADKTRLDMLQQQQRWENTRKEFEWTNPSAVQQAQIKQGQGMLGVAQGNLAVNRQQLELQRTQQQQGQRMAQLEQQFPALGLKGQPLMDYRAGVAKMDRAAEIGTDVADYLATIGTGAKALDRGTVNAMNAAYQQHVVPALTSMVGTGTIQKGDMEFVQSVMGNPGAWSSLDANQRQKVVQVLASVEDERGRLYGLSGVKAPPTKKGSSAWARSRGTVEAPQDTTWTKYD